MDFAPRTRPTEFDRFARWPAISAAAFSPIHQTLAANMTDADRIAALNPIVGTTPPIDYTGSTLIRTASSIAINGSVAACVVSFLLSI